MIKRFFRRCLTIMVMLIMIILVMELDIDSSIVKKASPARNTTSAKLENEMKVHFIDVGQGDCIFIELPNDETMLIDAGEYDEVDGAVTYIHSQGYDTIDYVIATHPHSDHIGGMKTIFDNFDVKNAYLSPAISTTKTYERMLDAIENSDAKAHKAFAGTEIISEDNLSAIVVAPATDNPDDYTENLNDSSVILKITYGETSFLFTGDAEKAEEDAIRTNIKCDVLKIGHHGSRTSTSANFLKKVEPKYAIISVGEGNEYGHPTEEVLKRLEERNIEVYRTDLKGTIVVTSDGKNIKF